MSKDTLSDCPLGLTADDLARFYNGELPENRAHSIADHLASCPVCGAHLTENARVGSDPISSDPIASAALPGLALAADPSRHEIAADKYAEHPAMIRGQKRVRAAVTGLGAIAAVVLVALAFVQLFASRGGHLATVPRTPTTAPMPTTAPTLTTSPTPAFDRGQPVVWKELTFPDAWCQLPTSGTPACGAGNTWAPAMLGVTAANPDTVYACVGGGSNTQAIWTIWRSQDRGGTWSRMGTLPSSQPAGCKIIADSGDVASAIVQLGWYERGASPLQPNDLAFATSDGGRTWKALPGNYDYAQMATYRGTTYILRLDPPGDPNLRYQLMASSDGMRTWRQLGQQAFGDPSLAVNAFWLNPTTGTMLVYATYARAGAGRLFAVSPDAGRSWRQITAPNNALVGSVTVQWPQGSEPWHVCIDGQSLDGPLIDAHNHLACTTDGGTTWVDRRALDITVTSDGKGGPLTEISALHLVGIAPDGALLATILDRYDDGNNAHSGLFRLPQTGTRWERVGDVVYQRTIFVLPAGVMWLSDGPHLNLALFWCVAMYVSTATYP